MIVKSLHQGPKVIPLFTQDSTMTIGRKPTSDVALNGPSASRKHARIVDIPGTRDIAVEDTSSRNGTFINGVRITEARVIPEDVLAFPDEPDEFIYKVTDEDAVRTLDLPPEEAPASAQ